MTAFRQGDVVLVSFDFTDRSGTKWPPAVIVSSNRYNQDTPDVLVASITGNVNALPHPGDHLLSDWQKAGLLRPSLTQTKLATLEATLIGRKLGSLTDADLRALQQGLRAAMGLV